ncbi:MAG TPA: response regulator [Actinomycetota bacterium]|nr:response regulator [Actinomycetota bacterium]
MESRPKVLIVEDDPSVRALLRAVLEDHCDVTEAPNGVVALTRAWDTKPDVIVLDRDMPVMTGDEAAPYLRVLSPESLILAYSSDLAERPMWADAYVDKGDIEGVVDVARARALVLR